MRERFSRLDIHTTDLYRVQADGLEIEAAAKRRLADEYDAAQERGEVAKLGDNLPSVPERNAKPATAKDVGLTRKEVHDARQFRDAEARDPGVTKRELSELQQCRTNDPHCCMFENGRFVRVCA